MLDRKALSLLLIATLSACGGDDDGDSSDGARDDGGGGNGDGGGGNNADAAVATCDPVAGTDLALAPVASGLNDPVFVTSPPGDTRLFVLERAGVIKIIQDGQVLDTPFLDIEGPVNGADPGTSGERGLLGLAFHPDYNTTGRFFVFYTAAESEVAGPGANVVAQYLVSDDPNLANAESEERLLEVADFASNHNGGMIAFGPNDGYLYIGMGDGGNGDDPRDSGQDRTGLLGDMLRIDVDGDNPYAIPADNPLVGQGGGVREEIWLSGLRNPWRWSFDMANGDMYIGDVGQDRVEEITVIPAGQKGLDLGWDEVEGGECFDDPVTEDDPDADPDCILGNHKAPVVTYLHNGNQRSVNGGYVYRGSCFPDIVGWYFYGDWITGQIWKFEGPTGANNQDVTDDIDPGGIIDGMSSFGQDIFGEVYVVSMYGGTIHRIIVE
jgi:glucose/arabinose dehydrogenase